VNLELLFCCCCCCCCQLTAWQTNTKIFLPTNIAPTKIFEGLFKLGAQSAEYPVQVAQLKTPVLDTLRGGWQQQLDFRDISYLRPYSTIPSFRCCISPCHVSFCQ